MFKKKVLVAVSLLLLMGVGAQAAPAGSQIEMLRTMFRRPVTDWRDILRESKPLLDQKFFTNVERRVRWGIENNHVDDAFRFAMVGDFAAEVKNKPANYRIDLAELFFKAENMMMTEQIANNIVVTSPKTEPARRATFLKAQLAEMQKNLFDAHLTYVELAESGYRPDVTWYKAGLISMLVQEETRGLKELKKAQDNGSVPAGVEYNRLKQLLEGDFASPDAVPPIENRPGVDTRTGAENTPKPPNTASVLTSARNAAAAGKLAEAQSNYQAAYKADPNNGDVIREMAALSYRMGALSEAKAFLDSSIAKRPTDAELFRIRANTLERMFDRNKDKKMLEAALADYSQALKLAPNHAFLNSEYQRAQSKR